MFDEIGPTMFKHAIWVIWTALLATAIFYFWWSANGEWIQHTEPTLIARDAVRYGRFPMALVLCWIVAFCVVLRISLLRLKKRLFDQE
jgi:hypothetical protein